MGERQEQSGQKENKMGVMPVNRLLISMSLPMMISMVVQALYNVVDSIFVAQLSQDALTSVTLAFPLQNLMIAIGSGTGVGINAMLSQSLGEKKFSEADKAANNGILLGIISALMFAAISIFGVVPFIATQTSDPDIAVNAEDYLHIVLGLSIGMFMQFTFERLLQSTGRTIYTMITQGTGAIINIIMDPVMIFGLLGFPKMGVAGAAYATVLGQSVAAVMALLFNIRKNTDIKLSLKGLKPEWYVIRRIYFVGVPSMLMMAIGSLMTYLMNLILMGFSSVATAVFGVYFKLQSFFFMPVFGLNNGLIPILAYNYGAKKKDRIIKALKSAIVMAVCIMSAGTLIFEVFPVPLLKMFNASDDMLQIGTAALRIICISFPLAGACIAAGSVFQAFSESIYSLLVSVGRQIVVLIPVAYLFSLTGNVNNVWWAFPIAESASCTLSAIFFIKIYRKRIAPMP